MSVLETYVDKSCAEQVKVLDGQLQRVMTRSARERAMDSKKSPLVEKCKINVLTRSISLLAIPRTVSPAPAGINDLITGGMKMVFSRIDQRQLNL